MLTIPKNYISNISIGGLDGRMLTLPSQSKLKKEILLLYGMHSSLERMYSNAQFHSRYGNVIMPDMPGFGGMDSFYKINREPDLDSYADYLYTFIRTYKLEKKKIRIVAMSFGFLAMTRLLQRHPELTENIEFVISFVGFGRTSDFEYPIKDRTGTKLSIKFGSTKIGSQLIKILIFNKLSLRLMFAAFRFTNPKYKHENSTERKEATSMELDLWTKNDARTRFYTYGVLADFDLTKKQKKIGLIEYNLTTEEDQYFNAKRVKKTLKKLYATNHEHKANMPLHAPTIIGTEDDVAKIYPASVKKILAK